MKGLKRDVIDKFYTKPRVVQQCMDFLLANLSTDVTAEIELVIEPSAGAGAFIDPIRNSFPNSEHKFYDIQPEHPDITRQDYLSTIAFTNAIVIGNPPFGRKLAMANKFIKHAAKSAKVIAFILPKSFKKQYAQKTAFPAIFHLVAELDLPDESFLVDGESHDVPCVFQIWEKRNINRPVEPRKTPRGFKFVKQNNPEIHLAFRRIGVNAGKVWDENFDSKSDQSHYFIRLDGGDSATYIKQVLTQLNNHRYPFNNTVGPKSISKQELIPILNQILDTIT